MADEDQDRPERSVAELQRIAFGRADSPAEKARADDALRQLQQAEADIIHAAQKIPARTDVGITDGEDADSEIDGESDDDVTGTIRTTSVLDRPLASLPRWLLPAVAVGLIAIGGIAGFAAGGVSLANPAANPESSPSANPSGLPADLRLYAVEEQSASADIPSPPPALNVGDITAAARWFDSTQSAEDALPLPLEMIDPATSRLVFQAPGVDAWSAWVGRSSLEDGFCLVVFHPESGMAESTCGTTATFISSGLSIATTTGVNLNWNGAEVTATRAR